MPRPVDFLLRRARSFGRAKEGAVAVELAVIAPVFLFLAFGCFELAQFQMLESDVHHVVRTLGRSLSVGEMQSASVQTEVDTMLSEWGGSPNATVTETSNQVTLTVTTPISGISSFTFLSALQSMSARSTLTFRKE